MDGGRLRPGNGARDGDRRSSSTLLPVYNVDDVHQDRGALSDAWALYMRERIGRREAFYGRLNQTERELVRKELRRIRYFREHFKHYCIAPTDHLPLVALLEDARTRWRDVAVRRADKELEALRKQDEKNGETFKRSRDRQVLSMVRHWSKMEYLARQKEVLPETFMGDLEATTESTNPIEDDPKKPNYGYNGWLIVWDQEEGGVSYDHPLVHGKFPHQKISIQQLLYNKEQTPLKRTPSKKQLRYFHLPANSMNWVEAAISRYYGEEDVRFDKDQPDKSPKTNAQKLLRNELWRGQQRMGIASSPHSRQMASRCSVVPSGDWEGEAPRTVTGKDIVMFMPFLHWEVEKRLYRMGQFADIAKRRKEVLDRLRRANTLRFKPGLAGVAAMQPQRPQTWYDEEENSRRATYWKPRHPLAKYLWYVAKLYQIIDEAADGRLIEDHLFDDSPLHMRRTLEQFYYWTAPSTARRDKEQVTCKGTRAQNEDPDATARLVMVDQLWLWILDENTVISCFPRRWGRNNPDPSAVHRGIRDRFKSLTVDEVGSVYDLASIVVDECSKVFFDRAKPIDQRPDVLDLYSSAISNTAERKTFAYEAFGRDMGRISAGTWETTERLLRKSLNIGAEWKVLMEAQNIIEELQVMQDIFTQQITVLRDCHKALGSMPWVWGGLDSHFGSEGPDSLQQSPQYLHRWAKQELQAPAMDKIANLMAEMEQRRENLASMEKMQNKTRSQLRELIDVKQQQSNIIEAKAAIRRADESVLQGRSIVVFTVVTIFFLPMSFFSSLFGMNAPELSEDGIMPLKEQLTWMFALSAGVIFVSLSLAFSAWTRAVITVPLSLLYAMVTDRLGWRERAPAITSSKLRGIQRSRLQQLESRAMSRRLTEISSRTRDSDSSPPPPPRDFSSLPRENSRDGGTSAIEMTARSPTWRLGNFPNVPGLSRTRRLDENSETV
ncbi:corA-like mg2+ transporter protein [Sarocladium implicatum]|nr:corA-like mg2+ transporter protein [Sarocladium implicatum]